MAVGRPAPTSRAKVGPDSTATSARGAELLMRDLVRQLAACPARSPWSPRRRCMSGAEPAQSPAAASGTRGSERPAAHRGRRRAPPGATADHLQRVRKLAVRQVAIVAPLARHGEQRRAVAAPQAHVAAPRANWIASAVPHEPAPSTAMGACLRAWLPRLEAQFRGGLRAWFAAYSASKFTGGSRNCGNPPWVTSCETTARAYGNSTPGADAADGALKVLFRNSHQEGPRPV